MEILYYFLLANSFLDMVHNLLIKGFGSQKTRYSSWSCIRLPQWKYFCYFNDSNMLNWYIDIPARRSAMTGVKGQKILILQQQRPTFSCTCLRYWFGCSPLKRISFNHLIMICKTIFLWNVGIWGQGQTTHWCYWEKVEMIKGYSF